MAIQYAAALNDILAEHLMDELNAALGGGAVVQFYDGTIPATCEDSPAGTLLGNNTCASTVFGDLLANAFGAAAMVGGVVSSDGTCQYFRFENGGTCVIQGICGLSGADIDWNTVDWSIGDNIQLDSFDITVTVEGS